MEGRVLFETELKKQGKANAPAKGRLPEGSLVTIIGSQKADFILVEVELENGKPITGWVNQNTLAPVDPDEIAPKIRPKQRVRIPDDEAILLRRKPSLFFGAALGGNYAIILPSQLPGSELTYTGVGFLAGAYVGFYLKDNMPLRFELNYTQFNGVAPVGSSATEDLGYGFMEIGVTPGLIVGKFELFAGFQYAMGLSIANDPSNYAGDPIDTPFALSTLAGQLGVGYTYELNSETNLGVRLRYVLHFQSSSILRHGIGLIATLGLQG